MKCIKERCLWFIGYDRMLNSNYSEFMYSENDIVLFEYDKSPNEFVRILRKNKEQVVDVFEKMVLWKWKDSEDLPKVERIVNDLDYVATRPNKPYSQKVINTAWWWFATGWIQATRLKVGNPHNYLFKVKFYNEEEVELRGQSFVEYMNARKNVNLEYVDALYTRGRFNSKGALKKFLNDELELNKGEPRA